MTDYIHIDYTALDRLPAEARYREAGKAIEQARQAVSDTSAYRDRVVAEMVEEYGGRGGQAAAAHRLDLYSAQINTHLKRHRERTMTADENEIYRYHRGAGSVARYPLLERVVERHDLDIEDAHAAILAALDQIIDLDGEDNVIESERPVHPGREHHNPTSLDRPRWVTVTPETVEAIEEALRYGEAMGAAAEKIERTSD